MKTNFKFIIVFSVFLAFTTSSCNINYLIGGIEGNGNVTKIERKTTEKITSIKAANGLDVIIVNSTAQLVTVETDENLHDIIETKLEDGTLYIKATKNIKKAKSKLVMVAIFDNLDAIEASSGANIKSITTVFSDNLYVKSSSGASIELNVLAKNLTVKSSSGSSIVLNGQSLQLDTKSSSGSSINANDLSANHATAKASSGATISLNVESSLNAEASSGGEISYRGDPKVVNKNASYSGNVKKM
ncbi:MAG: hypothetical protein AUK33_04360 [Flavobacteriaceae bacterium CG2_30_34_30]|nr:MAG: hypothetical protein AUK33_04360 [Flavobacteriaceae bacterium CG2_30_34_30]PIQ18009.1 MAG: DUF2807 domain-containing protein [Flavobacteriaceae bacterium CG18_big_fil_WC_8_21_14_2_50_34_36]PIV51508.1 MAG: DUF2807 domain-containing protein [Flavobacteriaceae bacterium CG02_land_8_20_14_3_00_34_13]PIZ07358.1 MAG: DUF2807 domain-containing protein [Flavobacteriaceae bacterium CG_4_10_14_0_8_um_filter_34_31]